MTFGGLLLSSALAGSLCRIPTHPIDTIKSRLQSSSLSLPELIKFTYRTEGIRGFYRGFGFTFLASLPASCLYFSSQEYSRQHLFSSSLASGFFAEAVACSIYTPIDVVKERIQASNVTMTSSAYNQGGLQALQYIVRTNGLRGLYKGYFVTLCSFGPFSALYFSFYELVRSLAEKQYGPENIPAHVFWLGAGGAGAAAAWITTPLDLVKLRMQLDPSSAFYMQGCSTLLPARRLV
ncbi:hypothetical protein BASA81_001403 [Batrachochytrium salamandrivorans]|nr:hypothetical protein BASA81_001403 [Batrachochytrium salamandrivorans]